MKPNTDQDYRDYDPFFGEEAELTCVTVQIKVARKEHVCYGLSGKRDHTIKVGDKYRYQKYLVDGDFWGKYKICLACMDKFISGEF